eukprot:gene7869-8719_t
MAAIFSIYVVNKAGSLIYQYNHYEPKSEVEKTFGYPLNLTLKGIDEKLVIAFGERDGLKVGHTLLAINGEPLKGKFLADGEDASEYLKKEENYPVSLKFGKSKLTTNERIMLASMFHSMFAIACKLSPVDKSSGIEAIEAESFKLHCYQTPTGVKFIVLTEPRVQSMDTLLRKVYELYSDYAMKNPFYSLEMPIRCELFDSNLQKLLEHTEKLMNFSGMG